MLHCQFAFLFEKVKWLQEILTLLGHSLYLKIRPCSQLHTGIWLLSCLTKNQQRLMNTLGLKDPVQRRTSWTFCWRFPVSSQSSDMRKGLLKEFLETLVTALLQSWRPLFSVGDMHFLKQCHNLLVDLKLQRHLLNFCFIMY